MRVNFQVNEIFYRRLKLNQSKTKLMVIIDPTSSEQIALEKALLIATLSECEIHAFVHVYEDISDHAGYSSIKDMKKPRNA